MEPYRSPQSIRDGTPEERFIFISRFACSPDQRLPTSSHRSSIDDSLTDQVHTQSPYNTRGARDTRNARDGIYGSGGSQLLLAPTQTAQGYKASFDISLDGVTVTPSAQPEIRSAMVSGKALYVSGDNFDSGAALLVDGVQQRKTGNDDLNPSTLLIARKSGKSISPGQTVGIQVRNLDSTLSSLYSFTRPA